MIPPAICDILRESKARFRRDWLIGCSAFRYQRWWFALEAEVFARITFEIYVLHGGLSQSQQHQICIEIITIQSYCLSQVTYHCTLGIISRKNVLQLRRLEIMPFVLESSFLQQ